MQLSGVGASPDENAEGKPVHHALARMPPRNEGQRVDVLAPDRALSQRNPPPPLTIRRELYLIERKSTYPIGRVGR